MYMVRESPLKSFSLNNLNKKSEFPKNEENKEFHLKNFENQKIKIIQKKTQE